jgi:hypothetical protein
MYVISQFFAQRHYEVDFGVFGLDVGVGA